jgi:iron complex transport system substrate-binding protein
MTSSTPVTSDAAQRIVSFLPSATEMICALGLVDRLAGVTHECDFPPEVRNKPIVVRSALAIDTMSQSEIDAAVTERLGQGLSLYQVDEGLLQGIAPDLIVTQDLCQVCAPSGNEVAQVLSSLRTKPKILWLTPKSLAQIFENLRELGVATARLQQAEEIIADGRDRLERIAVQASRLASRPRVFCMEWIDPVYCSGHWVPEMVQIAGGIDELGRKGADSVRVAWSDVLHWAPEVLIVMPCGCELAKAAEQARQLFGYAGAPELPAVRNGRVYAVDANSYFARPGPRIVDGTELLAHLLHPSVFEWRGPSDALIRLEDEPDPDRRSLHSLASTLNT